MYESIISNNSEYFFQSSIWMDIIRSFFWIIIKFLAVLSQGMESVFNSAYDLINFLNTDIFKNFVTRFSVFIVPVLTLSFLAIGLILTFSEKKPPILKNIAVGLAIIYVMPTIISALNSGLISAKNDLLDNSMTNQTVLSNVSDLSYVAAQGFSFSSTLADTCNNPEMALNAIDVTEHINPKKYSGQAKEVFSHYMSIDEYGKITWNEYDKKGMFDIFDPPWYYRYSIHFFQLFLYLIANILVFGFSAYAVIRMIYEIITSRILACLHSMDLASGEKTKKILEYFFQAYLILLFIPILLKAYLLVMAYTNTHFEGIVRAIIIFISALIVIDGPSIIQKIYGYDLGMSQGAQKVMSFMRLVQQQRMQHHMMQNSKNSKKSKLGNLANNAKRAMSAGNANNANNEPRANECYIYEDGSVMDIVGIRCKDLNTQSSDELEMDMLQLTQFFSIYKDDIKIISINIPTNCEKQIAFVSKKIEQCKNEFRKQQLDIKLKELEWVQKNRLTKEFFIEYFSRDLEEHRKQSLLISQSLESRNLLLKISKKEKDIVLMKMNNKNIRA